MTRLRSNISILAVSLSCLAFAASAETLLAKDVPFVPTPQTVVEEMLRMANAGPEDVHWDLGSGDGRIVITAVRDFDVKQATGVDIDPQLVAKSLVNAQEAGVADRARFVEGNIFEIDFSDATVVTMYLLSAVNLRLRPRILDELRPGTRVVSHAFNMGDWQPDRQASPDGRTVYLWIVPAKVAGTWRAETGGGELAVTLDQQFQVVSGKLRAFGNDAGIDSAVLSCDRLSFTATTGGDRLRFEGRVDGNGITDTLDRGGKPTEVTLRRVQ